MKEALNRRNFMKDAAVAGAAVVAAVSFPRDLLAEEDNGVPLEGVNPWYQIPSE